MGLVDEISDFKGKDIVVIMEDGRGYRGKLVRFDDEIIVLKDVYETLNQEVDERGYMFWRRVLHSKLLIRVAKIMRMWPWDAPKIGAEKK
jgi:small nuclear ribonucleoprotein (snRNP)-like protein